jgi:hypothetical protein
MEPRGIGREPPLCFLRDFRFLVRLLFLRPFRVGILLYEDQFPFQII